MATRVLLTASSFVILQSLGGGAGGTYSAIRLSDLGKSVAVLEQKDVLGGHTSTYTDPVTGNTIDYGVIIWHNLTLVKDYFARLNVSLMTADLTTTGADEYVDFRTGEVASNYTTTFSINSLAIYQQELPKYPYLELGYDLPYPVPSDLLLSFGDFIDKYVRPG